MRPPEFTGGNPAASGRDASHHVRRFNEAAGIHRRKPGRELQATPTRYLGFNEAAGIHRRKRLRRATRARLSFSASMRPPEFTGGNRWRSMDCRKNSWITASMRPPEFTGGNTRQYWSIVL